MNSINPVHLQIYVSDGCVNCGPARQLAAQMRAYFPNILIELCNLSDPSTVRPGVVFAVPTYLLNGRVVSLGNPDSKELEVKIRVALAARSTSTQQTSS